MLKRMQSAILEISRKSQSFGRFPTSFRGGTSSRYRSVAGGGGWILTIAVVVMMAMVSRHAASAEPVIQLKRGVTLNRNITIKAGFPCGTATVDDPDGNTYNTVKIGGQCWMKENLRYDGNPSGAGCSTVTWANFTDVGWCGYYTGGPPVEEGLLYQWSLTQGICPSGWHVPSDVEYQTLEISLGMCPTGAGCADDTSWRGTTEGDEMKKSGLAPDICAGATPPCGDSGFDALLAGYRDIGGSYFNRGTYALFWSSTPFGGGAWRRRLAVSNADVLRGGRNKAFGFSVRCLKD